MRCRERTCDLCGVAFCLPPWRRRSFSNQWCSSHCDRKQRNREHTARKCSARAEAPPVMRSGPMRLADISDADLVRLVDEMSPGQIAERLGVSAARVHQRLNRSGRPWRRWGPGGAALRDEECRA